MSKKKPKFGNTFEKSVIANRSENGVKSLALGVSILCETWEDAEKAYDLLERHGLMPSLEGDDERCALAYIEQPGDLRKVINALTSIEDVSEPTP